ncbi:E3 ubiquitin-protein ligase RSL1, partial [Quercus suber]|uniref:E3 ubiquitin-protein ligase RSL1 n=1 Tax=Quercus suber TaxID=58331 RepID=UPI0032DE6A5C
MEQSVDRRCGVWWIGDAELWRIGDAELRWWRFGGGSVVFGGSELWRMGFVIWWWIGDAGLWRSVMRSFGGGDLVVDRWRLVVGAVADGFCDLWWIGDAGLGDPKYVETQIDNKVANIKCPSLYCTQLLDSLFCRRIISKPLFDKWCDILFESAVLKVEEKCYCPDPQCSTLVLNECKIVTKSECPVCKKEFCFQCKTRWHAGYRCNESGQLRDENDVLLGRLIEEKKWSRCPNCGHAVERVDGCNDVICRCQTRFCHKCGQKSHFGQCGDKELDDNLCNNILQYIL